MSEQVPEDDERPYGEQPPADHAGGEAQSRSSTAPVTGPTTDPATDPATGSATGVPSVDRVLHDLDRVDELPLEEHLTAFERAHVSLRAALDGPVDWPVDWPVDGPGAD
jgi:hypothetical protein